LLVWFGKSPAPAGLFTFHLQIYTSFFSGSTETVITCSLVPIYSYILLFLSRYARTDIRPLQRSYNKVAKTYSEAEYSTGDT
jgi:hypothetical protein